MLNRLDERFSFLRGFFRDPRQVGSVIPSSQFLERRIIAAAEVTSARTVVELGGGTGGTTRAILAALPPEGALLTIEINPRFHARIQSIGDGRLIAHHGSAEHLAEALARHDLPAPDAVISGIPFSTMEPETAMRILASIESALAVGGRFVAYQVRDRVEALARPYFGAADVDVEILNIPPVRVARWRKGSDRAT